MHTMFTVLGSALCAVFGMLWPLAVHRAHEASTRQVLPTMSRLDLVLHVAHGAQAAASPMLPAVPGSGWMPWAAHTLCKSCITHAQ